MNEFYIIDAAAALYSGGWRKEDFEVLKKSAYFSVCIKPHGGGTKNENLYKLCRDDISDMQPLTDTKSTIDAGLKVPLHVFTFPDGEKIYFNDRFIKDISEGETAVYFYGTGKRQPAIVKNEFGETLGLVLPINHNK